MNFKLFKQSFEKRAYVTVTNKELGQPLRGSALGPRAARINIVKPRMDKSLTGKTKSSETNVEIN